MEYTSEICECSFKFVVITSICIEEIFSVAPFKVIIVYIGECRGSARGYVPPGRLKIIQNFLYGHHWVRFVFVHFGALTILFHINNFNVKIKRIFRTAIVVSCF